jgi:ArsR family transcriptional regulator
VLLALADEPKRAEAIGEDVDAPPGMIEQVVADLSENGLVERVEDGWALVD